MSEYAEFEGKEGHCNTCRFKLHFTYGPSPSGPEDGVHCTSRKMAEYLDSTSGFDGHEYASMMTQYGVVSIFRTEMVAPEEPEWEGCPCWQAKRDETPVRLYWTISCALSRIKEAAYDLSSIWTEYPWLDDDNSQAKIEKLIPMSLDEWAPELNDKVRQIYEFILSTDEGKSMVALDVKLVNRESIAGITE